MTLIRWKPNAANWEPLNSLESIREEMNRMFDTSARRQPSLWGGAFAPAIDVVEEKDGFVVRADLPGLSKDDVSVAIQDNILTIKGERKSEVEQTKGNIYHQERVYGQFLRTVELPVRVEAGKVQATFKDGVLTVSLPKSEEAKPKEIKVNLN